MAAELIIKLPFLRNAALTIKPFIFTGLNPDKCLIEHEKVHLRQQGTWFNFKWLWKWLTDKEFRWIVEKEALTVQFNCMGSHKVSEFYYFYIDYMQKTYGVPPEEAIKFINLFIQK